MLYCVITQSFRRVKRQNRLEDMGQSRKYSRGRRFFRIPIALELFVLLWLFAAALIALTAWPLLIHFRQVSISRTRIRLVRATDGIKRVTLAHGVPATAEDASRLIPFVESLKSAQPAIKSVLLVGRNGGQLQTLLAINERRALDVASLERFLRCIDQGKDSYFLKNGRQYLATPIMDGGVAVGLIQVSVQKTPVRLTTGLWIAMGISLVISFFVTGFATIIVRHRYLAPVRSLKRAARKVAQGDFDYEIPMSTRTEMNDLATTFNTMIATLRASQEKLLLAASTDPMTGLYTRRYFEQRLGYEVERARRYAHRLGLLMIDIDNLKGINARYGHSAGDEVLAKVGELVVQCLRNLDVVGRYGGEEFAVILPETSPEQAVVIAERIRECCGAAAFPVGNGEDIVRLTLCIGVSVFPVPCTTIKELLSGADRALYRAKDGGRNCVCCYDPSIDRVKVMTPHQVLRAREEANDRTTEILATAVGVKDDYTQGHSARVTEYAMQIGMRMNLSSEDRRTLRTAGLLHDVGKTGIPDEILKKPGALTQREQEIVRTHPSVGGYIVRQTIRNEEIISAIVYHHERWDGGGYPEGIKGERIPLFARILAVADTFDALTSDRPYREAMPVDAAAEEIARNAATQFDPRIVSVFLDCVRRNKAFDRLRN